MKRCKMFVEEGLEIEVISPPETKESPPLPLPDALHLEPQNEVPTPLELLSPLKIGGKDYLEENRAQYRAILKKDEFLRKLDKKKLGSMKEWNLKTNEKKSLKKYNPKF